MVISGEEYRERKYIAKIIPNLRLLGYTWDDFVKSTYCGGNRNQHLNYWKLRFGNKKIPEFKESCLCDHELSIENCYIEMADSKIIVLGNCCIKRFIGNSSRTCSICKKPHRNRKDNFCNTCRLSNLRKMKCARMDNIMMARHSNFYREYKEISIKNDDDYENICKNIIDAE